MEWKGFKFPTGLFIVYNENGFRFGKCHPITKEVIEWYETENEGK